MSWPIILTTSTANVSRKGGTGRGSRGRASGAARHSLDEATRWPAVLSDNDDVRAFRIDAVAGDGSLVEIQSGAFGPLKPKLRSLLPHHRIRVVKPIVSRRLIVRRATADGPDLSRRHSPRRRDLVEAFDDLVGLAAFLPDPNLTVELVGVTVEEIRTPRRRRPGFTVVDRRLISVLSTLAIASADDLWELLPVGISSSEPFTTTELARKLGRSVPFAQRVAYCLRLAGATQTTGKRGNAWIYEARNRLVIEA